MRLARAAAAAITLALLGLAGLPALAVQTDHFGLVASNGRTRLVVPAGAGSVRDSVLVYNLTKEPVTVDLDVVGVTPKRDGTFDFDASGAGLAAALSLDARKVALGPLQRRAVTVTVDRTAAGTDERYAAVTATTQPSQASGLAVTERLAVLVELKPGGTAAAGRAGSGGATAAVVLAAVALAGTAAAWLVARRRGLDFRHAAGP